MKDQELTVLYDLVETYKINNGEMAKLKKVVDETNKKIKETMTLMKLNNVSTPTGITAKLSEQDRASINSDGLVAKLKQLGISTAIKVIEVPDDAMIERMIYDKELDPQIVADCTVHKIIHVLKVK